MIVYGNYIYDIMSEDNVSELIAEIERNDIIFNNSFIIDRIRDAVTHHAHRCFSYLFLRYANILNEDRETLIFIIRDTYAGRTLADEVMFYLLEDQLNTLNKKEKALLLREIVIICNQAKIENFINRYFNWNEATYSLKQILVNAAERYNSEVLPYLQTLTNLRPKPIEIHNDYDLYYNHNTYDSPDDIEVDYILQHY